MDGWMVVDCQRALQQLRKRAHNSYRVGEHEMKTRRRKVMRQAH